MNALKEGTSQKNGKIVKVIPITKPGKEESYGPSKYGPISQINRDKY